MIKALRPYSALIFFVTALSTLSNILYLYFPKKVGEYIDLYGSGNYSATNSLLVLISIVTTILLLTLFQYFLSVYTAEKVALDLRQRLISSLKNRSFAYMREMSGGKLVTVMTSDVDAVKRLIASGIASILMSVVTLIGVVGFLISIDLKLALLTLSVMPFILVVFAIVFKKLGPLFEGSQGNLDVINRVINESIIASPLVRVLDARDEEIKKFDEINKKGTEISMEVVTFFSLLIPVITLLAEAAVLVVLWFGGQRVMGGDMTLGELSAFFAYTSVFIWPFFVLSFSSTYVSRAQVSLKRISSVLEDPEVYDGPLHTHDRDDQKFKQELKGNIEFKNVSLRYGEKEILKDISFEIKPNTKTAIIGPTGAGKTEIFYLITGLAKPSSGEIIIDGVNINEWNHKALLSRIGVVFQDSILFNASLKENILFKQGSNPDVLDKALSTAELNGLVKELSEGVETNISERGINLSGGQKQRIMLARALAIEPKVLLLDDFTSRVDAGTESRILNNINDNFKGLTLISITQKIEPIKDYDHIIVVMEGELISQGKHSYLLENSFEYRQIYESQKSTEEHS